MHLSTTATPDKIPNIQKLVELIINMYNTPKRARIWPQYTTPLGPHTSLWNKNDDAAVFKIPAPTIQNNQVTNIQMA